MIPDSFLNSVSTILGLFMTLYIVAAAIYLVITLLSQYILKRIDLRATRFERRPG